MSNLPDQPSDDIPEYDYNSAAPVWGHDYLWPAVSRQLTRRLSPGARVFDLGCGNGAVAAEMARLGFNVTAIDPSESGIAQAIAGANSQASAQTSAQATAESSEAHPEVAFAVGSAYDALADSYGQFDALVSLEVVEHCYWPRRYAATVASLLKPGGLALISTPYHGYLKNLALALSGQLESHWDPLWDGGHIKFFSEKTLTQLLNEQGLEVRAIHRVGRIGPLAKSMIAEAVLK